MAQERRGILRLKERCIINKIWRRRKFYLSFVLYEVGPLLWSSVSFSMFYRTTCSLFIFSQTSCQLFMFSETCCQLFMFSQTTCSLFMYSQTCCQLFMFSQICCQLFMFSQTSCSLFMFSQTRCSLFKTKIVSYCQEIINLIKEICVSFHYIIIL